jgi:DNA-binding FadR family transcriptional regulator
MTICQAFFYPGTFVTTSIVIDPGSRRKPFHKDADVARTAIERVKQGMISREFKPGDCLTSENELSTSMGVGNPSIRQAIKKVAQSTLKAEEELRFHEPILRCARSPSVVHIGQTIHQLFVASISRSMKERPDMAIEDHRAIFDAFSAWDAVRLQEAIFNSFQGWEDSLEDIHHSGAG